MKRPDAEVLDVSRWAGIDIQALGEQARRRYHQSVAAIDQYVLGLPISEVESKTKLDRRTLYRTIERALLAHPDGRPWGFRALIPGAHTKPYQRRQQSAALRQGLAGSFTQLAGRAPTA